MTYVNEKPYALTDPPEDRASMFGTKVRFSRGDRRHSFSSPHIFFHIFRRIFTKKKKMTDDDVPKVSTELKAMVDNGDDEIESNPFSLGWGKQQIKLQYWDPENEKYWEV